MRIPVCVLLTAWVVIDFLCQQAQCCHTHELYQQELGVSEMF